MAEEATVREIRRLLDRCFNGNDRKPFNCMIVIESCQRGHFPLCTVDTTLPNC